MVSDTETSRRAQTVMVSLERTTVGEINRTIKVLGEVDIGCVVVILVKFWIPARTLPDANCGGLLHPIVDTCGRRGRTTTIVKVSQSHLLARRESVLSIALQFQSDNFYSIKVTKVTVL